MKTTTAHPLARIGRAFTRVMSVFIITAGSALADNVVKLQVTAKSDHDDPKGANNPQEIQKRWLEITSTAFQSTSARLEWAFYGDNLDSDKVVKHGEGSETVNLVKNERAAAKTKPVTFSYTPRHGERTGSGRRARVRTVEATGVRYHGWGVRAFVDGKLAGEAYSSSDIQRRMNGG